MKKLRYICLGGGGGRGTVYLGVKHSKTRGFFQSLESHSILKGLLEASMEIHKNYAKIIKY